MQGLLSDPLFAIGSGLLAAGGPSSTPVSFGQAMGQGFGQLALQQQWIAAQQQAAQRAEMERVRLQMAQDQFRLQQEEAARLGRERGLLGQAAEEYIGANQLEGPQAALLRADPGLLSGMVFPQGGERWGPPEIRDAGGGRQVLAQQNLDTGEWKAIGGAGVNISLGGEMKDRPLTPEEAARFGIPQEQVPGLLVSGGKIGTRPLTEAEKQQAKTEESMRGADALFSQYEDAFDAYHEDSLPTFGTARAVASDKRQALVAWVAKNVLGTPGAEPSPKLYEQAEAMVPDFAGPLDTRTFKARLKELKKLAEAKRHKGADPTPTAEPPPGFVLD